MSQILTEDRVSTERRRGRTAAAAVAVWRLTQVVMVVAVLLPVGLILLAKGRLMWGPIAAFIYGRDRMLHPPRARRRQFSWHRRPTSRFLAVLATLTLAPAQRTRFVEEHSAMLDELGSQWQRGLYLAALALNQPATARIFNPSPPKESIDLLIGLRNECSYANRDFWHRQPSVRLVSVVARIAMPRGKRARFREEIAALLGEAETRRESYAILADVVRVVLPIRAMLRIAAYACGLLAVWLVPSSTVGITVVAMVGAITIGIATGTLVGGVWSFLWERRREPMRSERAEARVDGSKWTDEWPSVLRIASGVALGAVAITVSLLLLARVGGDTERHLALSNTSAGVVLAPGMVLTAGLAAVLVVRARSHTQ